nr:unnamed protein product [Callosobruchus analis]
MSNHSEAADSDNLSLCIHCNATFKSKTSLDDHTIREHPDFIASVSCKVHECPCCTYKTTVKGSFDRHMLKHPETVDSYKLSVCVHCDAKFKKTADIYKLRCIHCDETFKRRAGLDEHIIKKHPHLIATITSKIHECTYCAYQTVLKPHFARHMLKHPETADNYKHPETADSGQLITCTHCEAKFKSKQKLDEHTLKKHPDLIASVSSKIHECIYCTYKTTRKDVFLRHMEDHPEAEDSYQHSTCIHCNAVFKRKRSLDDHIVRKHPDFIAFVSSKIHECTHCSYKTAMKANLNHHMLKHPETADSYRYIACVHCNATYKTKKSLDDHTIRKHPDSITCITSKVHKCAYCTYKTTVKGHFTEHMMLEHHETADRCKFSTCVHCNTTFIHKQALSDHILTKHPESIGSVSSQIYECTLCAFRTVSKPDLDRHMVKHPETEDRCTFKACVHCNATFKSKTALNDHTLKKHPESIGSVSSKNIYECTQCSFKTVKRSDLARHMLKHPETANQCKFSICVQCKATFKSRPALDDHTLKKHPESIGSVASKNIYECTQCTFKTVKRTDLARHMLKHPEAADRCKFSVCVHCNATFKSKPALVDHTLRKHPDSVGSISIRTYECTHCAYKTCMKRNFAKHILKHPHPDFMASISSKIHQCKYCTYKTTWKSHFARHMLAHPETADSRKLNKCIRCNTEYKHKIGLDEHILRQHPELIASVSNKMHECTHCAFKTVFKDNLTVHMVEHHETADICKFSTCVHCNTTFIDKQALSDHIHSKHPGSIGSVSRKIYECTLCAFKTVSKLNSDRHMLEHPEMVDRCTFSSSKIYECPQCTFKTVMKSYLTRHMLKHPETADRCKFSACVHCNATFKSKPSLVDHTLRKHPDSVESNSIRIYECTHCAYKTCLKRSFTKHILKHP